MIILVDMDEVLVGLWEKSVYYYNKFYPGEDIKLDDIKEWTAPGDDHKWAAIWRQPSFFMSIPPARGAETALEVIRALEQEGHSVFIVSSPISAEAAHGKYIWFHSYLVVPGILPGMRRLVLTRSKHLIKGDVLIDDGVHNLESFDGDTITYDQPWNRDYRDGWRVKDWSEVEKTIDCIQRARSYRKDIGSRIFGQDLRGDETFLRCGTEGCGEEWGVERGEGRTWQEIIAGSWAGVEKL